MYTKIIKNTNKTQTQIIGFDEVGRGPLAGPVVVACVANGQPRVPSGIIIRDSKTMSKLQRQQANTWILQNTQYAIAQVSAEVIDAIGINPAIILAATKALQTLTNSFQLSQQVKIVIDGRDRWFEQCETHIKGESKFQEIAMASIIAKEYRDHVMQRLDIDYPQWQFSRHVGYGTSFHRLRIMSHGLIPGIHRKTFCTSLVVPSTQPTKIKLIPALTPKTIQGKPGLKVNQPES